MNMLSKIFVLSIAVVGSSYSMDMDKEEAFKADMAQLRKPIADFVNDFAT